MDKRIDDQQNQIDTLAKKINDLLAEVTHMYNLKRVRYYKQYFKNGKFVMEEIKNG